MTGATVPLQSAGHLPLRDVVAAELRRLILCGELHPGDRLVEDRLAERLGVSRNPVREALAVLAAEGFVEVQAHKGACVARLCAVDAEDLYEVRLALEPVGARLAAGGVTGDGVAALRALLAQSWTATENGELDRLSDLNTAFHCTVMELSGNGYLSGLAEPMIKRAQWLFRHSAAARAPHSWTEHQELLEAIAAGDEAAAQAAAYRHVLSARSSFRDLTARPADRRAAPAR